MFIQALPLLTLNPAGNGCSLTAGAAAAVTYSIGGPNMTQIVNGVVEPSAVVGVVAPGSCMTEVIQAAGPYSVSLTISGLANSAQVWNTPNANQILTYLYVRNVYSFVFFTARG